MSADTLPTCWSCKGSRKDIERPFMDCPICRGEGVAKALPPLSEDLVFKTTHGGAVMDSILGSVRVLR